jgi:hypothetical protein
MEIRNSPGWSIPKRANHAGRFLSSDSRISIFLLSGVLMLASCGSPGDPQPLRPRVPTAVNDLAVRQAGDGALLTFTPPRATLDGEKLDAFPDLEILRGFVPAGAKVPPPESALRIIYTVPSAVVDTYLVEDRVEFNDPLKPEDIAQHSGQRLVYIVRSRVSKRQASPDSNLAGVVLFPAPARIRDLGATVVEAGVSLSWTSPDRTTGGQPLGSLSGFRIYRAEVEPLPANPAEMKPKSPPLLVGVVSSPSYLDAQIEWGRNYSYTVRSVAQYPGGSVESSDSAAVQVSPRDIFPPAPPRDVVAVYVPAAGETPANVELSWAINTEPDLAGYIVYRNESGTAPVRLNPEILPTPTFRDMSVVAGGQYTYMVTAIDHAGNESRPSAAVASTIPKPGQ